MEAVAISINNVEKVESKRSARSSSKIDKAITATLFFLVLGLPLFFGGVHESTWHPISSWVLGLAAIYIYKKPEIILSIFSECRGSRIAIVSGILFLCVIAIQAIWFYSVRISHPVLGSAPNIYSWSLFNQSLLTFLYAFSLFILARGYFRTSSSRQKQVLKWITFSSVIVSTIALSQWFYDNGKLLWLFSPDFEFISHRARWPFVNSNHLGAFLLLTIFPTGLLLFDLIRNFRMPATARDDSKEIQNNLLQIFLMTFGLFVSIFALFGTLSRGSWAGFCMGGLLISIGFILSPKKQEPSAKIQENLKERPERRQRTQKSRIWERSAIKYLPPIILVVAFLFFLRGKSAELFEDRIVFGLLYSLEDIRLQMDSDTLSLINAHPIFGVGFGNWEPSFFTVASPLLSGLNPEYLHSDPLQLLSELGALGLVPIAFLFYGIFIAIRSSINDPERRNLVISVCAALLAFLVGSFVEFSFRIPALISIWAILLSLLFSASEDEKRSDEVQRRKRRTLTTVTSDSESVT